MTTIYFPIAFNSSKEVEFFQLLHQDSRQRRKTLIYSTILEEVARKRAESFIQLSYWGHCDPTGKCPNRCLLDVGWQLPSYYSPNGNNVESLVAGTPSVTASFDALARSPRHAVHLFGENEFFLRQSFVGIGYAENPSSPFGFYFCILITE